MEWKFQMSQYSAVKIKKQMHILFVRMCSPELTMWNIELSRAVWPFAIQNFTTYSMPRCAITYGKEIMNLKFC